MKCTNCGHEIADTAKFCDQCGTRRPPEGDGDESLAKQLCQAGVDAVNETGAPADCLWAEQSHKRYFGILAKARELLCGPKDEEIARLKAALEGTGNELAVYREALSKSRTAAANARREALLTDKDVDALADHITKSRQHWWNDTSIAACVARWIEKRASQPAAETQTHRSGCMCDDCKLEGLQNASDDAWLASQAQPPARDVEGLARVLCERSGDNWGVLDQGEMDDYMADARAVFAHLDGGPST